MIVIGTRGAWALRGLSSATTVPWPWSPRCSPSVSQTQRSEPEIHWQRRSKSVPVGGHMLPSAEASAFLHPQHDPLAVVRTAAHWQSTSEPQRPSKKTHKCASSRITYPFIRSLATSSNSPSINTAPRTEVLSTRLVHDYLLSTHCRQRYALGLPF